MAVRENEAKRRRTSFETLAQILQQPVANRHRVARSNFILCAQLRNLL
jgi:hypothetical protein